MLASSRQRAASDPKSFGKMCGKMSSRGSALKAAFLEAGFFFALLIFHSCHVGQLAPACGFRSEILREDVGKNVEPRLGLESGFPGSGFFLCLTHLSLLPCWPARASVRLQIRNPSGRCGEKCRAAARP